MLAQILGSIRMLYEIFNGLKALAGFVEANKNERWFQDVSATMAQIKAAKTEQEYKDVAKKLRDLWSGAG